MSEILSLTKVVLRNSAIINGRKNKKVNGNNQILTLFSYLIILIVFSVFSYELMSIGPSIGLKDEMFRPVIFYTILITFGLSFVSCFNIYFLGQNIDTYLAMPIKPTNLFIAYFLATSYYSLLTSFSAISAAFIPYMVVYGFSFYSLIAMIVTIITVSTVINSLSFIVGNILAKLFNLASHKQALTIAMTIFLIVCITGSTFYVSFSLPPTGDEITNIELIKEAYINVSQSLKPLDFIIWLPTKACTTSTPTSLLYSLAILGVCLAFLLISLLVAKTLYLPNLLKGNKGTKKKNKVKKNTYKIFNKKESILKTFIKYDLKTNFKQASNAVTVLVPTIIFTIVNIVTLISLSLSNAEGSDKELMTIMFGTLSSVCFYAPSSAIFSFSKEGHNLTSLKSLPIDFKNIIKAKFLSSYMIEIIPLVCIFITSMFIRNIDYASIIVIFLTNLTFASFFSLFDLYEDLKHVIIDWENEVEYTKRINVMLPHMAISFGYTILISIITSLTYIKVPPYLLCIFALLLGIGLNFLMYNVLNNKYQQLIDKI